MARRSVNPACNNSSIPAQLAGVLTKLQENNPAYEFEQAQIEIDKIYQEWKSSNSNVSFKELITMSGLDSYNFVYESTGTASPQLVIDKLDYQDETLFRYRDTAKNKIKAMFSHQVFENLFINRDKQYTGRRYITTKSEFNQGIIRLKNSLAKIIINNIDDLSEFKNKGLFSRSGAVYENGEYVYTKLMNHSAISSWLNRNLKKTLEDPIQHSRELAVIEALYALNNFDTLLEEELQGLLQLDPAQKGTLNNTNYSNEIEGNSTEYWVADTHEDKSITKYTSNLAKFIMRQIPKVNKIGNTYVPIEGQYLSPNDLYVLSSAIKQAEQEYNLKHQDKPIVLAVNLVDGIKRLFDSRSELPSLRYVKSDLIHSFQAFLWEGSGNDLSISEIFKNEFLLNRKVLDVESLLDFEIYQSTSPFYMEFSDQGALNTINYGGAYRGGNALKWGITECLYSQLDAKRKIFNKKQQQEIVRGRLNQEVLDKLLYTVLDLNKDSSTTNLEFAKQYQSDLIYLAKAIVEFLNNPSKLVKKAQEESKLAVYKTIENEVDLILKKKGTNEKSLLSKEFKSSYIKLLSDIPITQFESNSGATIPVYRLNSALTSLQWFMHQYRQTQSSEQQNFFSKYPFILSKYSTENLDGNQNQAYKGYAGYLLGFGQGETTGFHEMTPSDQMQLLFLTNLQNIKNNIFSFQPVCYSDKVSIGVVNMNLDTIVQVEGHSIKMSDLIDPLDVAGSILKIQKLDYKFRKNNTITILNSIIDKWKQYIQYSDPENPILAQFQTIDLTGDFARNTLRESTYKDLVSNISTLNSYFSKFSANNLSKVVNWASINNIEFVDQLDYVRKGDSLSLNQSLLQDFYDLQSVGTFSKRQNAAVEDTLQSTEFQQMIDAIKEKLATVSTSDFYYQLLVQDAPITDENGRTIRSPKKYFDRKWNSKERRYDVFMLKTGDKYPFIDLYKIYSAMSNLGRYAFIDLMSKSYYLDPAKGKINNAYEEISKRIDSMAKRMVLYPATIQAFQQGRLDGVSNEVKVAVIEDPSEKVWNMQGDTHNQDIFDGSGFLSPFESMMEDNSVPGHGIKGTKKTLGTSTRGHNSALFKWAGFPITNEKMRNSISGKYNLANLFYKMHNEQFNQDIDITKNYVGLPLKNPVSVIGKSIYVSDGFIFKEIAEIAKVPNTINTYTVKTYVCDKNGNRLQKKDGTYFESLSDPIEINSIYDIWTTFGGMNSMERKNGTLEYSEASIEMTFEYIVGVGRYDNKSRHLNQQSVKQDLRDKFIGIAACKSAVKRGAANINTTKDAWETPTKALSTFTINTASFGVQLDANHHSDLADVREMSQTISTLASGGQTTNLAQHAYNSIADLVDMSLKKVNKYLSAAEHEGVQKSIELISEKLVQKLATEDNIASTAAFIEMFANDVSVQLPVSDRRFYKEFIKTILEDLNKSSIIRRYSGLGGVLNPASNIMQIYSIGDKTYTFSTLLKEARTKLMRMPDIRKGLTDLWLNTKLTIEEKNRQLVIAYLLSQQEKNAEEIVDIISHVGSDFMVTLPIHTSKADTIKLLDTITYKLDNEEQWYTITLDTPEKFIQLWNLIDENVDYVTGVSNIKLELVLSTPHDLRPQHVSWKSVHQGSPDGVTTGSYYKPHSIYSTKAARLASTVGQIKLEQNQLEAAIAELSQTGQDLQQHCKNV